MTRIHSTDLDIVIRRINEPTDLQETEESYSVVVAQLPWDVDADAVSEALHGIVRDATGYEDLVLITETRSSYEWGASGGAWSYVVELAAHFDEAAIGAAISIAFDKIRRIVGEQAEPVFDRERALNSAQWAVRRHDSRPPEDSLEPVSEEQDREANRWTFSFRPDNGYEYIAEVGWHGTLPGATRVTRRRID